MSEIRYRDGLGLNDKIPVEMPVHVWLAFMYTYANSEWSCAAATDISLQIQKELLHPIYLKEAEAEHQARIDAHNAAFQHMTGQKVEIPPNITDDMLPGWTDISRKQEDNSSDPEDGNGGWTP